MFVNDARGWDFRNYSQFRNIHSRPEILGHFLFLIFNIILYLIFIFNIS